MVREWLGDMEDHAERARVGEVGVRSLHVHGSDRGIALLVRVVDVERATGRVEVGREGDAEEPALAAAAHAVADVEEGLRHELAVPDDADPAGLLDDEQPAASVSGAGHADGLVEAGYHALEPDRDATGSERLPGGRGRAIGRLARLAG